MASITDFLQEIPEEDFEYQVINNTATKSKAIKEFNSVTFDTEHLSPDDLINNTGKVGLCIWVDRDHLNEFVNRSKEDN